MGRRYASLTGRKLIFVKSDCIKINAIVGGSDWSIGLTIQEDTPKKDKQYFFCTQGPKSPIMKGIKFNHRLHRLIMAYIYDEIKSKGIIESNKLINFIIDTGSSCSYSPSAAACAFSQ